MNAELVKQQVRQFREKTAHTGSEAHSFAPWYLHFRYHLSETQAMQQASDGNYDFGVDGFHLQYRDEGNPPTLVLVQSKFTESLQLIANGFKDLERTLGEVRRCLDGIEPENPIENKVLMNIRGVLNRLPERARREMDLELQVLHLSTEDEAIVGLRVREAMTRLSEVVGEVLEGHKCSIRHVGPRDLGPQKILVVPPERIALRLNGAFEFVADESCRMVTDWVTSQTSWTSSARAGTISSRETSGTTSCRRRTPRRAPPEKCVRRSSTCALMNTLPQRDSRCFTTE